MPVFFQAALRTCATVSGLLLIPLTLAQVIVSTTTGLRIQRPGILGRRWLPVLSIVMAPFFYWQLELSSGRWFIALLTCLIGAGLGSTMPAAQTWSMGRRG